MISRTSGISEQQEMVVSDGFVVAEGPSYFSFRNSPFNEYLSLPTFYTLKVHEGHPLVIYHSGGGITAYPKEDFDAIRSDSGKPRFPAEWSRDRIAHDLAAFVLAPYDVNEEDVGWWEKIHYFIPKEDSLECSLLYAEHGLTIPKENQLLAHVMPSAVMNHFYAWMRKPHPVASYDKEDNKWTDHGNIRVPVDIARDLTHIVNNLLQARFETEFMLNH